MFIHHIQKKRSATTFTTADVTDHPSSAVSMDHGGDEDRPAKGMLPRIGRSDLEASPPAPDSVKTPDPTQDVTVLSKKGTKGMSLVPSGETPSTHAPMSQVNHKKKASLVSTVLPPDSVFDVKPWRDDLRVDIEIITELVDGDDEMIL